MKKYITFIMITVALSITLIACNDTDDANNNNNIVAENNDLLENDSDNSEDIENNLEDEDIFADESEDNQEEVTNEDDMKSKMEEFGFEYLELDYEFEKPYKAKVEIDEDGEVLAELDDDEADEHLKGPEAFNAIFEDYSGAFNNDYETKDVSYSTEDQQVVEGASGAFYINSAFSNGKVKIKYDNGKEINAEHSRD